MELLLRWVTPRTVGVALLVLAAALVRPHVDHRVLRMYREWRYPPQGGITTGGREILDELERKQALEVRARYDRLMGKLEKARADGYEVGPIERKARAALRLNTPQYRRIAVRTLAELDMVVPRKRTRYIPMRAGADDEYAVPEDVRGRRAKVPRR